MCDFSEVGNIKYFESGITDGLADHQAGVGADRRSELLQLARLHKAGGDTEARQRVGEQIDAAAVKRGRGDDVVASIKQRGNREVQRGHAAGRADRADASLQPGEPLFEHRGGRVGNSGVDMPRAFEVEQRGGMLGILKKVRSGLIYRDCTGARDWIGMLSGMEAQGLKRGRLGCGHVELGKQMLRRWASAGCAIKAARLLAPGSRSMRTRGDYAAVPHALAAV